MQLEFPGDVEASIQSKAVALGFLTVEEYIIDVLGLDVPATKLSKESPEEWLGKFDALIERQTSRNPNFDDSRESIYPVR